MAYNQDATPFYRIRHLCRVGDIPEAELILRLEYILSKNPEVVRERDGYGHGRSLLHIAAGLRSVGFVKLLVELDSAPVRSRDIRGWLPFHIACMCCNVETVKYLYHEYPESIDMQDVTGDYPLHTLLSSATDEHDFEELVRFLLEHDQGAVSTSNRWGHLPLHYACRHENLVQ